MSDSVRVFTPIVTGVPRTEWCAKCKALSGVSVDVLSLFPSGPASMATVTFCEICDDPDDYGDGRD